VALGCAHMRKGKDR